MTRATADCYFTFTIFYNPAFCSGVNQKLLYANEIFMKRIAVKTVNN